MSILALVLVLSAAVGHASWNFLAKRASGGTAFIWLFGSISALLYFPLALGIVLLQKPTIGITQLAFMLGSGVLHSFYFILLDKGYQVGDLSIVYPLARGTGPLVSTLVAIIYLGERPSLVALAGALLIGVGVHYRSVRRI